MLILFLVNIDAAGSGDSVVRESRKVLQDAKEIPWKVQGRLKDSLRELENLQEKERCLAVSWIAPGVLAVSLKLQEVINQAQNNSRS